MKVCQVCDKKYTDDNLNFCLDDGGILNKVNDEPPPTVFMNQARSTNQNWTDYETASPWRNQPLANNQPFGVPSPNQFANVQGSNQVLPTVSLTLGILGIVLSCCYGGIPLGVGALITGYLALNNINREPMIYSGRGMAIAGMATGAVGLVTTIFWLIIVAVSK